MLDIWTQSSGYNFGTFQERFQINLPLPVTNVPGNTNFKVISGALPPGLRIEGQFIIGTPGEVPRDTSYAFCIRASHSSGIADRTFNMIVQGPDEPRFITPAGQLRIGENEQLYVLDSSFVDFQIGAIDTDTVTGQQLSFFIASEEGELPPGLLLTQTGRITGFVQPALSIKVADGDGSFDNSYYDNVAYDFGYRPTNGYDSYIYDLVFYDFALPSKPPKKLNRNYEFIATISDGDSVTKRKFKIFVVGDDYFRADNVGFPVNSGLFTADAQYLRQPIWTTPAYLGTRRANNYVSFILDTYEALTSGIVIYSMTDEEITKLPPGMQFDPTTSEVFGSIPYQPAVTKRYSWTIVATRYGTNEDVVVTERTFYVDVIGEIDSVINWQTNSDLGIIDANFVSTLKIQATSTVQDAIVVYTVERGELPVIVEINPNTSNTVAAGCADANFNTTLTLGPLLNGKNSYTNGNKSLTWNGFIWTYRITGEDEYYKSVQNVQYPWQITEWTSELGALEPAPSFTQLGGLANDGTIATLTFPEQFEPPFKVGAMIKVEKMSVPAYNGVYSVLSCTTTNVTYKNTTRLPALAGTISNNNGGFPPGLVLDLGGEVVGKVNQYGTADTPGLITFDNNSFSIDQQATTIDRSYSFIVKARDQFGFSAASKAFTLLVQTPNNKLYSNISVAPLLKINQRKLWKDFITDSTVFTPENIYRPNDTNFGVQRDLKMLIYAGIETTEAGAYVGAIGLNHKKKTFRFGEIKKAVAVIPGTNTQVYEVVYVEMLDPLEPNKKVLPQRLTAIGRQNITLTTDNTVNFWDAGENIPSLNQDRAYKERPDPIVTIDSQGYLASDPNPSTYFPNSVTNWKRRIRTVGSTERNYLPLWMRSIQPGGKQELDFQLALPICYCKIGGADDIILNIKYSEFDFKTLEYTIDRYVIDSIEDYTRDKYLVFRNDRITI
jgi:hypothetical protein